MIDKHIFEFQANPTDRNFEKVLKGYEPMIRHLAAGCPQQYADDYQQVGRIAVYKSAQKFRPGPLTFSGYVFRMIRRRMLDFARTMKPLNGIKVEDMRTISDPNFDMFELTDSKDRKLLSDLLAGRAAAGSRAGKLQKKILSCE